MAGDKIIPKSTVATTYSDEMVKAATAVASKKLGLPENIGLASLMTWLTMRMSNSDATIRSKMGDMNARKEIQDKLSELAMAFSASRKGADQGYGFLAVTPPLDNPKAIIDSAWFGAMDATTQDQVKAMLSLVHPETYLMKSDVSGTKPDGTKYHFKAGGTYAKKDLEAADVRESDYTHILPRMDKNEFERVLTDLGQLQKTAASSDEIEMIELQSAISARSQLLQMVSNMLASFNDTLKHIGGNFRS